MDEVFDGGIDKPRLKALSRRSDARGSLQLASHAVALAGTGALVVAAPGLWLLPAMALHGLVLIFLFAPLHETIHRTAFANRRLNDAVAWVCGALLVLPPEYFRAFHFAHHRYTQDTAKDPELAVAKPSSPASYLWTVSGLPYWIERVTTTLKIAAGRVEVPFIPQRQHAAAIREARWLLAVYAAVALISFASGSGAAVTLWLVPALLGQPFLRAYLLAEHTGCPLIPDRLKNSRTPRSNAVVRWLAWNMPYHAEHHAYPALPFHALPAAHDVLRDRIAVQATGYLAVQREIWAGFGAAAPAAAGD